MFVLFIIIHRGYFLPKPDLNIHLHLGGSKAGGEVQQDGANGKNRFNQRKRFIRFQIRFIYLLCLKVEVSVSPWLTVVQAGRNVLEDGRCVLEDASEL